MVRKTSDVFTDYEKNVNNLMMTQISINLINIKNNKETAKTVKNNEFVLLKYHIKYKQYNMLVYFKESGLFL